MRYSLGLEKNMHQAEGACDSSRRRIQVNRCSPPKAAAQVALVVTFACGGGSREAGQRPALIASHAAAAERERDLSARNGSLQRRVPSCADIGTCRVQPHAVGR